MKILVDADACQVVKQVEEIAKKHNIETILFSDTSHIFNSDYCEVRVVDQGADAVDFAIMSVCKPGDIVVTQDYGVAAMVLGKGAKAIHHSGMEYTDANIDRLLMDRHLAKKERAKGKHRVRSLIMDKVEGGFEEEFERMVGEKKMR